MRLKDKKIRKKTWILYGSIGFIVGLLPLLSPFICGTGGTSRCFNIYSLPLVIFDYIGLHSINIGHPPLSVFIAPFFYLVLAEVFQLALFFLNGVVRKKIQE